MKLGGDAVTIVTVTEDPDTRDRYGNPATIRTETYVPGCRFRPLTATEKTTDVGTVTEEQWKLTAPPVPAALSVTPADEIVVDGQRYGVVGVRRFTDAAGKAFKVTVVCQRVAG